jgi:SanA protein
LVDAHDSKSCSFGSESSILSSGTTKIMKKHKGFITAGLTVIILLSMPFASTLVIKMQTADEIYETVEEVPQKELALVLGAAAYPSGLSDILQDRVDTAIELYEAEKVSVLIMSGAQHEAEAMKEYAVKHGIPETAITEDIAGVNTMASIENISILNRSLIIVTQKYHLPRALFIAHHLGLDAVGVTADRHEYTKMFEFKKRELLATTKAVLDLFVLE